MSDAGTINQGIVDECLLDQKGKEMVEGSVSVNVGEQSGRKERGIYWRKNNGCGRGKVWGRGRRLGETLAPEEEGGHPPALLLLLLTIFVFHIC